MRFTNSFFKTIYHLYGPRAVSLLKLWIKYRKIVIVNRLKISFLRDCIDHGLTPAHLTGLLKNLGKHLSDHRSIKKFNHLKNNFIRRLLHVELSDAHGVIRFAHSQIFQICFSMFRCIPSPVCDSFINKQTGPLHSFHLRERTRLNKKFSRLLKISEEGKLRDIKPIRYRCFLPPQQSDPLTLTDHTSNFSFKFDAVSPRTTGDDIEIFIDPARFEGGRAPFQIRDGWFINLSSIPIPNDVQGLLQLGENFSMPLTDSSKLTMEFIKNIENNLRHLPAYAQLSIRNRASSLINNLPSYSPSQVGINLMLNQLYRKTKKFLIDNSNLILTRADKGNVTVALDKNAYLVNMNKTLSDSETYVVLSKDPTKKLITSLREILTRWKNSNHISSATYKTLYCSDGNLPRAYGLPKIHKRDCPYRIIVSSLNSPLYHLAFFLHKIMLKSFPKAHSNIVNSFQLTKNLSNVTVTDDFKLLSLDVISLFTNIPIDLAIESIEKRIDLISNNCSIPPTEFILAIKFVLNSTFFTFNGTIYKQTYGTPMGSPLSPIIADIVLQDLEEKALSTLTFIPSFYVRYVDDIAMTAPFYLMDYTVNVFNSLHPRIQFTLEIADNDKLNFLDISILLINNRLLTDWFHKPTFSGRYLNFLSQHPTCQKRGTIIGLVDRAFLLSHPQFHQKNLDFIIKILLDNNYPLDFIFQTIFNRLKYLITRRGLTTYDVDDNSENVSYFTIPFVHTISHKFKNIIKDLDVRLSYCSLNKLSCFIRVHKDVLPSASCTNVIYVINCADCDASYVGQTGRRLQTRIGEHRNHIRRNSTVGSVITDHRLEFDHDFDWDHVRILDSEKYLNKRLISEMLFIRRQINGLNLQTDTEGLHQTYITALDKLPNI